MGTKRDLFYICLSGNNLSINFLIIEKTGIWGFIFCLLLLKLILAFLFKKLCSCPKITQPEFEHQSNDKYYHENFILLKLSSKWPTFIQWYYRDTCRQICGNQLPTTRLFHAQTKKNILAHLYIYSSFPAASNPAHRFRT